MSVDTNRRTTLLAIGAAAFTMAGASSAAPAQAEAAAKPADNGLAEFAVRLRKAPRRRDFKSVPMILDHPSLWDDEALNGVLAYKGRKQVWDNTQIDGPWMNGMRNALNAQVFSFHHSDFLIVSATHGPAQLALYDQEMWDKYKLADLTRGKFLAWVGANKANTLIVRKHAAGTDPEDPKSIFGPAGNTIPALQDRGVVFLACHIAIWELAEKLIKKNVNPDNHSAEALAAELTNHLVEGVVLTPGIVATLPELQAAGFHYLV